MKAFRISILLALLFSPMTALAQDRSAADRDYEAWKDHIVLTIRRTFEKAMRNVAGLPRARSVVQIVVKPNGEIVSTRMHKPSGIDKLDHATQVIIKSAGPFRPAPASYQRSEPATFMLPIDYNKNPFL